MNFHTNGIIVSIQGLAPGGSGLRATFSYTIKYNDPAGGTCQRADIRSAYGAPWEAQGLHTFPAQPGDGFPVDVGEHYLHAWIVETQAICP